MLQEFHDSPGLREYPRHHDRAKTDGVSLYTVLPQFNADVERSEMVIAHNLDFDLPSVTTKFYGTGLRPVSAGNKPSAP